MSRKRVTAITTRSSTRALRAKIQKRWALIKAENDAEMHLVEPYHAQTWVAYRDFNDSWFSNPPVDRHALQTMAHALSSVPRRRVRRNPLTRRVLGTYKD